MLIGHPQEGNTIKITPMSNWAQKKGWLTIPGKSHPNEEEKIMQMGQTIYKKLYHE